MLGWICNSGHFNGFKFPTKIGFFIVAKDPGFGNQIGIVAVNELPQGRPAINTLISHKTYLKCFGCFSSLWGYYYSSSLWYPVPSFPTRSGPIRRGVLIKMQGVLFNHLFISVRGICLLLSLQESTGFCLGTRLLILLLSHKLYSIYRLSKGLSSQRSCNSFLLFKIE